MSSEGTCQLPRKVWDALGLKEEGIVINIKNIQLPKATFVKLQPFDDSFLDIIDYKSTLENNLRTSFTILSVGDIISINNPSGFEACKIIVKEVVPSPAACIVNTDCEVEFDEPLNSSSNSDTTTNRSSFICLNIGELKEMEISRNSKQYFRFNQSPSLDLKNKFLELSLRFTKGDGHAFISLDPVKYPTQFVKK